jgi:kynureninase
MGPNFEPMPGAEGWQLSNPSIMSMAPLRASLEIFAAAGMQQLRDKSKSLTGYLEFLLDQHASRDFTVLTPREPECRGAQLSIRIRQGGRSTCDRLVEQGVLCDWREPDVLRVAPMPLYNTYGDVQSFVEHLVTVLA